MIVRLDEDAADRDVDHADVGAVFQTRAAKPADIVQAEAHVTAPFGILVRIDDGVGETEDLDVGRVQLRDGHNVRNSKDSSQQLEGQRISGRKDESIVGIEARSRQIGRVLPEGVEAY